MRATFDEWWTFASTILGALIGAIVAGGISYILAKQANKEIAERDRIERRYKEKSLAFSLIIKVGEIVSSLAALHHQNEENISRAEAAGVDGDLWGKMIPIVGTEKRIYFTSEEIAVLLPLRIDATINSLLTLDDQHNSLLATMSLYSQKRSAFGERFGAEMSGNVGQTAVTIDQYRLAAPAIAEMQALALSIRAGGKKWFEASQRIFSELASALGPHFSDVQFPEFKIADYQSVKDET